MQRKRNNHHSILLLRYGLVISLVCLFVSFSWGQELDISNTKNVDYKSKESKVELLELLSILQEQTDFTFIFDEKIIQNKTIYFDKTARLQLNRLILKEITRQTDLQFTVISQNTFVIKRKQRAKVRLTGSVTDKSGLPMVGVNIIFPKQNKGVITDNNCLLYTSPSPRDATLSRMPSSA